MAMNGKITLVSNKSNGQITEPTIAVGTTLKEVLAAELGLVDPDKYQFVVNGEAIKDPSGCQLKDGDFVVISPTNYKGN